jgi:hypothetical protein
VREEALKIAQEFVFLTPAVRYTRILTIRIVYNRKTKGIPKGTFMHRSNILR